MDDDSNSNRPPKRPRAPSPGRPRGKPPAGAKPSRGPAAGGKPERRFDAKSFGGKAGYKGGGEAGGKFRGKPFAARPERTDNRPPVERSAERGEGRPARDDRPRPPRDDRPRPQGRPGGFGSRDRGGEGRKFSDGKPARPPRPYGSAPRFADGDRSRDDRPRGESPRAAAPVEDGERIAKRLARAGIASRREAEDLVTTGRIRVNGKVLTSPAFNVATDDRIELDGTEIPPIERTRLFLFHKPPGVVTTNRDPEGRRTVFDVLPPGLPRLMTVGRLDINTEGLLLLTNDGGLSRLLELPTTGWLRRYRVRVHGAVDEKALAELKHGLAVDGLFYGSIEASLERVQGTNAWLSIGLREGKNREVKNVLGALGLEVTRLIRVSFGPFQLGDLPEGQVQELKGRMLRDQLGERLIEEAGANFEAPITRPFSSKAALPQVGDSQLVRTVRPPAQLLPEPGEGGLIKGRKRRREDRREEALGRLSTKPAYGGKGGFQSRPKPSDGPRGKGEQAEKRPIEPPGQRRANVWMAPGARPQGKADSTRPQGQKDSARPQGRKDQPSGKPAGRFSSSGKSFAPDKRPPRPANRAAPRPGQGGKSRKPRPE